MLLHKTKHQNFTPAAAGSVSTLNLPVGPTYHKLKLLYKRAGVAATEAQMRSDIELVRLKLNGVTAIELTGAEIIDILNKFHDIPFVDGYLNIPLAFSNARSAQGEDAFAWGTADVSTFQVEVTIAAGAVTPSLEARSYTTQDRQPLGVIRKFRKTNIPVAAIGKHSYTTFPKLEPLVAFHCQSTDIDNVEVTVDNVKIFNQTDDDITENLTTAKDITPQAGYTHVTFGESRRVGDMLPMRIGSGNKVVSIQELGFTFDMSAATPFDIVSETVGQL